MNPWDFTAGAVFGLAVVAAMAALNATGWAAGAWATSAPILLALSGVCAMRAVPTTKETHR